MEFKNGKTISINSVKGGVGKTITTINLAGIYQILNKKILIIDFDIFNGAIALSLNVKNKKDLYNLIEDLKYNQYESFNHYVSSYNEYIDVLSCPVNPTNAIKLDYSYINNILVCAKSKYDVILIDTTHGLSELNLLLLDITDVNLLMITNDPYDLKNIKNLIFIFKDINKTNYKILLNESRDISKNYFTNYDIKKIIDNNIDYTLPKTFYIKDIDKYIINNEILVLNQKIVNNYKTGYDRLLMMAKNLIEELR